MKMNFTPLITPIEVYKTPEEVNELMIKIRELREQMKEIRGRKEIEFED